MRLEITQNGEIVLREVTDEAWGYIAAERYSAVLSDFQHWVFISERYDGTVYITATAREDKTELVRIMDKLVKDYELTVTKAAMHVLEAWRKECEYAQVAQKSKEREHLLQAKVDVLGQLLKEGCNRCRFLAIEMIGDDVEAYCMAADTPKEVQTSDLGFEHGEWSADKKVYHVGRKYYPCNECALLKGDEV